MMSLETVKQRFTNAVRCLADEPGPIKERLLIAYVSQLSAIHPRKDLPDDFAADFEAIKIRLEQDQVVGDRGKPATQIKKMKDEEASDISDDIFSMFLRIHGVASE